MSIFSTYRDLQRSFNHPDPTAFVGLFDFMYQHYALGDTMTMEADMAVRALEAGRDQVDLIIAVDPTRPSAPVQNYITPLNYLSYFDGLFPAFLCTPMLRSIAVVRDRPSLNYHLVAFVTGKQPMWVSFDQHLRTQPPYPLPFKRINAFFRRRGYIPKFNAPRGYDLWAKEFLARHMRDRIVVVINPRQSALGNAPAALYRDAPFSEWLSFVRDVGSTYPWVMFIAPGGFAEWESTLQACPNVFIPRTRGLNLAHELALLANADMFLGTMSGFSNFIVFTDVPYGIFNLEHRAAEVFENEVGAEHLLFGRQNQILTWEPEDASVLMRLFERILGTIDPATIAPRRARGFDAGQGSAAS